MPGGPLNYLDATHDDNGVIQLVWSVDTNNILTMLSYDYFFVEYRPPGTAVWQFEAIVQGGATQDIIPFSGPTWGGQTNRRMYMHLKYGAGEGSHEFRVAAVGSDGIHGPTTGAEVTMDDPAATAGSDSVGGGGFINDLPKAGDRPHPPEDYGITRANLEFFAKYADGTPIYTNVTTSHRRFEYIWEGKPDQAPSPSQHLLQYGDFEEWPEGNKWVNLSHVGNTVQRWQWILWSGSGPDFNTEYHERPNLDDVIRHELVFLNPSKGPSFFEPWDHASGIFHDKPGTGSTSTDVADPRWPEYATNYDYYPVFGSTGDAFDFSFDFRQNTRFYKDRVTWGSPSGILPRTYYGWEYSNGYRVYYCTTDGNWYVYPNVSAYLEYIHWRNWFTGRILHCVASVSDYRQNDTYEHLQPASTNLYYVSELKPYLYGGSQAYASNVPLVNPVYDFEGGLLSRYWYERFPGGLDVSGQKLGSTEGTQFSFNITPCEDELIYNYFYPQRDEPWFTDADKQACMIVGPWTVVGGQPTGVAPVPEDWTTKRYYDKAFIRGWDAYGTNHYHCVYMMPAYKMIDENYIYQSPWGFGEFPGSGVGEPVIPRIDDGTLSGSLIETLVRYE